MHITPPTPEQIAALRERAARTADLFRAFLDGFKELARRICPFLRNLGALLKRDQAPAADPLGLAYRAAACGGSATSGRPPRMTAQARPAWASPYGPAPRRA